MLAIVDHVLPQHLPKLALIKRYRQIRTDIDSQAGVSDDIQSQHKVKLPSIRIVTQRISYHNDTINYNNITTSSDLDYQNDKFDLRKRSGQSIVNNKLC